MAGTSHAKQDDLKLALKQFARSSRYSFLKGIEVGRLLPQGVDATGSLSELTFEDLTQLYTSVDTDSCSFSAQQEESLLHLILALIEEEDREMGSVPASCDSEIISDFSSPQSVAASAADHSNEEEVRSSVQTELELREALKAITSHPQYESVRNRKLGEFWSQNWTPAPFEESMTIGQLASFDLALLFKKKMVSDTRAHSIYRALERVRAEISGSTVAKPEKRVAAPVQQKTDLRAQNQSLSAMAYYEILERAKEERKSPELARIIDVFLRSFSSEDCARILATQKLPTSCIKRLTSTVHEGFSGATLELATTLLQGPGVRVDTIACLLQGPTQQISAVSRIVATIVVRGLGASAVVVDGQVVEGFWTLNPQLLTIMATELAQHGGFESDPLCLDPILLKLLKQSRKTQGRSVPRRKEKRNRLKSRSRSGK
jgi:hypothetical protein